MTKPLLAIVGPTASGKSALALELAQKYGGEIICGDSRTIYKNMDIGTAKPSFGEQELVKHHCLDIVEPCDRFSAGQFKVCALRAIEDVQKRGKLPILVGGSGLYVDSVLFDFRFADSGAKRDGQNPRHLKEKQIFDSSKIRPNTLVLGMNVPREELIRRIEQRIDAMLEAGFGDEVRLLVGKYGADAPGLLAPGYKAFVQYLLGRSTFEEAKQAFIRNDKQLAKRQMTWFRRNPHIVWVQSFEQADAEVATFLSKFDTIAL